jgi:hypothetical protein
MPVRSIPAEFWLGFVSLSSAAASAVLLSSLSRLAFSKFLKAANVIRLLAEALEEVPGSED